jgi:hypothetical protein
VARETLGVAARRARARDDRRRTEADGAQADDEGSQGKPPRGGQGQGAPDGAALTGPRCCRSRLLVRTSLATMHKDDHERLRNPQTGCHNRCRLVQRGAVPRTRRRPVRGVSELRDRDSNPNFRSQNPASYH